MELKVDQNFINNVDTGKFSWRKALTLLAFVILTVYAFYFIPFGLVADIPTMLGVIVSGVILSYFGKRSIDGIGGVVKTLIEKRIQK